MNHALPTSSTDSFSDSGSPGDQDSVDDDDRRGTSGAELEQRKQQARRKRLEYLDDLLRNFDILIYAELSALYYLE